MTNDTNPDALWEPIVEHGTAWCAPNVCADAQWLTVRGSRWRVAITRPCPRNSYVVSATGQYLDYAREEIRRLPSVVGRTLSHAVLRPLAPLLRALDPVLILDALPVSTVLHATRTGDTWGEALEAARASFPGLPIVVRSLDECASAATMAQLRTAGAEFVPSRLVFHQDPRHRAFWRIRNVRNDLALSIDAPLPIVTLTADDAPRIAALYWMLYGQKHSQLNPQFSPEWLAHAMRAGVFGGEGLSHDGRLAAAYLSYRVEDLMTNPVFGYDTMLPQQLGLYRRLSLLAMQTAQRDGLRLHASSGAPGFKATRGGMATMEYHAIDLRGVAGSQRWAWRVFAQTARAIAPAIFRSAR
ncbi:MAG: hypothetical protein H7099_08380 [Gemmatimonadaceae bacterium]|nr:hypothetical protein [Gemmatimonadaceae bacterium]